MGQKSKNAGKKKSKTCDKLATTKSVNIKDKKFKLVYVSPEELEMCYRQGVNPVQQYTTRGNTLQVKIGDI